MPVANCPPEIRALMTVSVGWESFIDFDGHGDPSYRPLIQLKCWFEEYSVSQGGMVANRRPDVTVVEPEYHMYFAGDDSRVRTFTLYDRFTTYAVGDSVLQVLQPIRINTMYGPPFDNRNPWMVEVAL